MIENIRLSFQGIWAHKMRSFLTMLGIIIGIAAVEKDDESEGSSSPNADAFAEGKAEAESDASAAEAVLPQGTEQEREQIGRLLDAATREDEEE